MFQITFIHTLRKNRLLYKLRMDLSSYSLACWRTKRVEWEKNQWFNECIINQCANRMHLEFTLSLTQSLHSCGFRCYSTLSLGGTSWCFDLCTNYRKCVTRARMSRESFLHKGREGLLFICWSSSKIYSVNVIGKNYDHSEMAISNFFPRIGKTEH